MLWSAPLQITISLVMLWRQIGHAALAGVSTMIIFVPLNIFLTSLAKKMRKNKMKFSDSRIKTTNEILNGIKVFILKI